MKSDTLAFCFLSDTQEPFFLQNIFMGYDRNSEAREAIFSEILSLDMAAIFHLGDFAPFASIDNSWEEIDRFTDQLQDRGVDFNAIQGNHEYWITSDGGMQNYATRFPQDHPYGYSKVYSNIAFIMLNSNIGKLSDSEASDQLSWYQRAIDELDKNASIDHIVVACHHSPFTNSKIVSASEEVQARFLPAFHSSDKTRVFLSGHAHAFEHFKEEGKDFMVIGGGGGSLHPLHIGDNARYKDVFSNSIDKRMFHFIVLRSFGETLSVDLMQLNRDYKTFERIPRLTVSADNYMDDSSAGNPVK